MRTNDEIVERIQQLKDSGQDFFGFQSADLIGFLPFELAKAYLREESIAEYENGKLVWEQQPNDRDGILKIIHGYMEFAWDKANNCRGLSASRSIEHMTAWTWMLGEEEQELYEFVSDNDNYYHYGKPILEKICQHFNWDYTSWDNGYRGNDEDDQVRVGATVQ